MKSTKRWWVLKKYGFLIAAVIWLLAASLASLMSASFLPEVKGGVPLLDKLVHAVFYMIATFLLFMHFRNSGRKTILIGIGVFCFVYGMVIEVLQYVMPYERAFEWKDMLANGMGIILAIMLIKFALASECGLKGKF